MNMWVPARRCRKISILIYTTKGPLTRMKYICDPEIPWIPPIVALVVGEFDRHCLICDIFSRVNSVNAKILK